MSDDDFGDWRIAAPSSLAEDVPAAFPGGLSYKAGDHVYLSSLVETGQGELIGFITPSATAMALNIAIAASKNAANLHAKLSFDDVNTFKGPGKSVSKEKTESLYEFFEQCMVSAVFSFQAVEVFCNHAIKRELHDGLDVKRRKKRVVLTPTELERQLTTEEKLSQVLPKIKKVPTPKGKSVWEPFKRLQESRDSTVHLKSTDQETVDQESLFYQFLDHRASEYPRAAVGIIRYFVRGKEPRWLALIDV